MPVLGIILVLIATAWGWMTWNEFVPSMNASKSSQDALRGRRTKATAVTDSAGTSPVSAEVNADGSRVSAQRG